MFEFITQHQSWAALALYWIFSAAVSSMPEPGPNDAAGYLWLYRFCHTTAGNISTAFGSKISGMKALVPVLIVPLLLSNSSCAAHYTVHPGSLNKTDSAAYDTLLIAEAAIDQARKQSQTQVFSPALKGALNTLIRSYNVTRQSWLTYRGALATNVGSDAYFNALSQNLADLADAIRRLKEAK